MKKSIVLTAIHVTTTTAKQFVLKVTYIHMSRCSQLPSFFLSLCTSTGFSIEGGTRRLIAAYFGIYSRLLCV